MNDTRLKKFYFSCFKKCFDHIKNKISGSNQNNTSNSIRLIQNRHGNLQYNFDVEVDNIIKSELLKHNIVGKIFSEESGFFDNGELLYRVVYDPVCNSSLLAKTILDAACGIIIFSKSHEFILAGILDYQTGIIAIADEKKKIKFYQLPSRKEVILSDIPKQKEDIWMAIKLETKEERVRLDSIINLVKYPERLLIGSGHIYWLRLAMGIIDGYANIQRGEKLYEMFAATVAQTAGCIVTDLEGNEFNPEEWLRKFRQNPGKRYKFIAARNKKLHNKLIGLYKNQS